MTLTQWTLNDFQEQLKLYRDIIYEQNELTDEVNKKAVEKQLLEETIEKSQGELDSKLQEVEDLAK